MKNRLITGIGIIMIGVLSAHRPVEKAIPQTEGQDLLVKLMTGSFNSEKQAKNDSSYFNISLHMYPIWEGRKDAVDWLYVEQAVSSMPDKPYRQRVYKLEKTSENTYQTTVYKLANEGDFIGKWKETDYFDTFDKSILEEREGCTVYLKHTEKMVFEGATREDDCKSSLRGASYATTKVKIEEGKVYSWDQGFDENGEQVWGAIKGGYLFEKLK